MASNVERLRGLFARFNDTGELDFTRVHPDVELHEAEGIEPGPEETS